MADHIIEFMCSCILLAFGFILNRAFNLIDRIEQKLNDHLADYDKHYPKEERRSSK
jgi:hypothetical protein